MNDSIISVRYAKALFQSAIEKKILDRVNEDMLLIAELCKVPETAEFLKSPIIIPSKKTLVFHEVFGPNVHPVTLALIDLLVRNGRESYLPSIARVFNHETLKYREITKSVLATAYKVDAKVRSQIIKLISDTFKTKVELEEVIDSEIIGGFILRVEDNYIDASIRSKLNRIKKELNRGDINP